MKILIVLPNDSLGGAEQYLKMLASYYQDQELSIYFLKNNHTKQWQSLQNNSRQYFMSSTHELLGLLKFFFIMLFKHPKYDEAYSSHTKINALIGLLRRLKIIKINRFIVRESTSIFLRYKALHLRYYRFLYAIGYKKTDLIICQTDLMKNQFVKHNQKIAHSTLVEVIPNPIDLSIVKQKEQELFTKPGYDYVVSAGRLIPEKGYDILIKAFSQLKQQHPSLKLVLLGNGNELEKLKAVSEELQLEDDVIFAGHVANVYAYFKNAKLCVVSSRIEGFPNVLLQMLSQNTKVVSTLCAGGIEDIPGIFTSKTHDDNLLAKAMLECLSTNTEANTETFNAFLNSRSIYSFVATINKKLQAL